MSSLLFIATPGKQLVYQLRQASSVTSVDSTYYESVCKLYYVVIDMHFNLRPPDVAQVVMCFNYEAHVPAYKFNNSAFLAVILHHSAEFSRFGGTITSPWSTVRDVDQKQLYNLWRYSQRELRVR